ncbi:MAG: long-chain fatty acid--CoA ligase [Chloroflexota bacterium]|nr:MAG: long-chain fatty acid--CoA ligase [Chloroflexota bacterium]
MNRPWQKMYEKGVPEEIVYPEGMVVTDILDHAAARFPNSAATIFPTALGSRMFAGRLSYRDLEEATNRFANALIQLGVQKGDRVALLFPNSPQFVIAFFGALKAGAVAIAFNPIYTEYEIERQLNDCGAETVVTMTKWYPAIKKVQANTRVTRVIATNIKDYFHPLASLLFTLAKEKQEGFRVQLDPKDYSFKMMLQNASPAKPNVPLTPDDVALLQYTGGTTGVPKGAVLTHRNLVANCLQSSAWFTTAQDGKEITLAVIPFFHMYGMQIGMLLTMYKAGALVLFPRFDLDQAFIAIDTYKPTIFPGVPALYIALINSPDVHKHDLRSVRMCLSGAAPLPQEVQTGFEMLSGGRLVEGYGMTESSPLTHANPINGERRAGSIGVPVPSTDARIVDPENPAQELPHGAVGELAIKGPQVFQGYWNRPEESVNTLRDGWLITGDIARMDDEGFFYIVERKKDMIIVGGYKVFPRDIEEELFKYPKVKDATVIGIPHPKMGEVPKAFIVLKEGEKATEKEIVDFMKANVADYKVPRQVEFRDALPKTIIGKVLKRQLAEEEKAKAKV